MNLRKILTRTGAVSAAACGVALIAAPMAMAATQGPVQITDPSNAVEITSGNSTGIFELRTVNNGGFCTGSTQVEGYTVTGYITNVDTTTLTWDPATGPASTSGLAFPMVDSTGSPYISRNTNTPDAGSATGQVLPSGALAWERFVSFGVLTPGNYRIGLACIAPDKSLDNYYETQITVSGSPDNFTWQKPGNPVIPEVPYAVILPATGVAALGAGALFERRRRQGQQTATAA